MVVNNKGRTIESAHTFSLVVDEHDSYVFGHDRICASSQKRLDITIEHVRTGLCAVFPLRELILDGILDGG